MKGIGLQSYLSQRYCPEIAKRYGGYINSYCTSIENPKNAGYASIIEYLDLLRNEGRSGRTVEIRLQAIKQYYYYLIQTGQRMDHPCRYLKIRDGKSKSLQLQDLFNPTELEKLLLVVSQQSRCNRFPEEMFKQNLVRQKVIISLLIYQGLTISDLIKLKTGDIDLENGSIYISSDTLTNARTLYLESKQIMLLHTYINSVRPKLLSLGDPRLSTSCLLISMIGRLVTADRIQHVIERLRYLYPEKKLNPKTIRQSVIANLSKGGKDLRLVQVFAGHKQISTTEKYKENSVELLKQQILKHHPLG